MSKIILALFNFLVVIKISNQIFNGRLAKNTDFPSLVVITFNDSSYCGGSVILPQYILTSAVCASNQNHIIGVVFNFDDLFDTEEADIIAVNRVVIHPNFKLFKETAENDIAIMELTAPITFSPRIGAIPILEDRVRVGKQCKIAGFGVVNAAVLTEENVEKAWPDKNFLRSSEQLVVDLKFCESQISEVDVNLHKDNHICTRGITAEQGPSYGDFGGPLICEGQQAGVATHSLYDEVSKFLYTVYTPVIVHEEWIRGIVGMEMEKYPPTAYTENLLPRSPLLDLMPDGRGGRDLLVSRYRSFALSNFLHKYLVLIVFLILII